jgi:hypothetical protein
MLFVTVNLDNISQDYLNPTEACHTNAKSKNKTGITGNTSTIGLKTA